VEEEGEEDLAFLLCWCRRNHPRFDMVARCALLRPDVASEVLELELGGVKWPLVCCPGSFLLLDLYQQNSCAAEQVSRQWATSSTH
jgi:hypothetical protein